MYLAYLKTRPQAGLFFNLNKPHAMQEIPLKQLEIDAVVRDTLAEIDLIMVFKNELDSGISEPTTKADQEA